MRVSRGVPGGRERLDECRGGSGSWGFCLQCGALGTVELKVAALLKGGITMIITAIVPMITIILIINLGLL